MPKSPRFASRILILLALLATSATSSTSATSATSAGDESSSPEQVTMDRLRVIAAALQSFVNDATSGDYRLGGEPTDWVLASQPSKLIRIPSESELLTYRELFDLFHPLGPLEDASYLRDSGIRRLGKRHRGPLRGGETSRGASLQRPQLGGEWAIRRRCL